MKAVVFKSPSLSSSYSLSSFYSNHSDSVFVDPIVERMRISLNFPEPRTILRFIIQLKEERSISNQKSSSSSLSLAKSCLIQTLTPSILSHIFQFSINYVDEATRKTVEFLSFSVHFNHSRNTIELILLSWKFDSQETVNVYVPKSSNKQQMMAFSSQ